MFEQARGVTAASRPHFFFGFSSEPSAVAKLCQAPAERRAPERRVRFSRARRQ
jgi:hypothetical protein